MTVVLNGALVWLLATLLFLLPFFINAARRERQEQRERAAAPQAQVIQFPSTKKDIS